MSGEVLELRRGGRATSGLGARQDVRDPRTLLKEAREVVAALERLVAEDDRLAETVAAAEARRRLRVVS